MSNQELLNYISNSIRNGISKDSIYKILLEVSWKKEDIDAAFLEVESSNSNQKNNLSSAKSDNNISDPASKSGTQSFTAICVGSIIICSITSILYFYQSKNIHYQLYRPDFFDGLVWVMNIIVLAITSFIIAPIIGGMIGSIVGKYQIYKNKKLKLEPKLVERKTLIITLIIFTILCALSLKSCVNDFRDSESHGLENIKHNDSKEWQKIQYYQQDHKFMQEALRKQDKMVDDKSGVKISMPNFNVKKLYNPTAATDLIVDENNVVDKDRSNTFRQVAWDSEMWSVSSSGQITQNNRRWVLSLNDGIVGVYFYQKGEELKSIYGLRKGYQIISYNYLSIKFNNQPYLFILVNSKQGLAGLIIFNQEGVMIYEELIHGNYKIAKGKNSLNEEIVYLLSAEQNNIVSSYAISNN